jgi:hypothetical protein
MNEIIMQRLAFINFIFNQGVELSRQPEPMSCSSVLPFHDSIDLFLQLAYEECKSTKKVNSFMDYWEAIKESSGIEITQKEGMRRLNDARVGLKHHGNLSQRLALDGFKTSAFLFFEENTPLIFHVNFDDIDLINLVKFKKGKSLLMESKKLMGEAKFDEAVEKSAIALAVIIDEYEANKTTDYADSPFFFGERMTHFSSH